MAPRNPGLERPARRFLGRPDASYPGFVPGEAVDEAVRPAGRSRSGRLWLVQAVSGGFLVLFLGIHLVAQHFLAPGGLRDYASVAAYLASPVALAAEIGLLVSVLVHAVLGLRSVFAEVVGAVGLRRISVLLTVGGSAAFVYALWLTVVVIIGPRPA